MVNRGASAPLLANVDPRESFDEGERELLQQEENKQIRRERKRMVMCLLLAIVLTSSAVAITFFFAKRSLGRSRNVIMMVSDGFGPASQTYGRSFYQYKNNYTSYKTALDEILVGTSRTRSSDSLVTDSAAGATAFACALKTYNNAIGLDPDQVPCGTILEAAKALGMLTGLVVTSRVTHATPASFSAHVVHRDLEADIATHQIGDYVLGRQVDLMMGGGKCFFMPNTTEGSCRQDDRDLLGEREKYGWSTLMTSLKDMNDLNKDSNYIKLPALGLFNLDHLNYMIDTNLRKDEPTLSQMAEAALKALKRNAGPSQGFFLMIEGSRIDMGAHNNDPVAHLHEILEYHATVAAVRKFVKNNPNTLLISTSDHETGGFTLGYQPDPHKYPDYQWFPEVIDRATASTEILAPKVFGYKGKDRREYVRTEILRDGLGITDPTKEELDYLSDPSVPQGEIMVFLGHAISHRAYLGWTTIGHTGLDVNLYAEGENSSLLRGNHENTEIGQIMSEYLNVDLQAITKKLTKDLDKWFKPSMGFFKPSSRSHHEKTGH